MENWHNRPAAALMQELDSGPGGLTEREAARRLERYGPNELASPQGPSLLSRVLGQMKDPMILVLLGAAALSLAASRGEDWLDGVIILAIVAVNAVISITQEDNAQRALEELRRMSAPMARVLRDGQLLQVPAAALVPGDVFGPGGEGYLRMSFAASYESIVEGCGRLKAAVEQLRTSGR